MSKRSKINLTSLAECLKFCKEKNVFPSDLLSYAVALDSIEDAMNSDFEEGSTPHQELQASIDVEQEDPSFGIDILVQSGSILYKMGYKN